jgi:2-polyprenyl-3-methyl-5-hydroxy-6-metoxy-1,4-benzoquinol methylase
MQREQYDLLARLEDSHWWFVGRRRILNAVVDELLPPPRRGVIVDIGCGAGGNLAALADRHECIGIDASEEALSHARRRFPKLSFLHAPQPQDVSEVIGRANLLMLNDVLEHIEADRAFLEGVIASASPGAQVLITVPADSALWGPHDVSHGHFRRYTAAELQQVWQGLPVETQLVSYFNTRLYPIIRAIRTLGRWRDRAWGAASTDLRPTAAPINALLTRIFAGESGRLQRALRGKRTAAYRYGVSLLAVLRVLPQPDTLKVFQPAATGGQRSAP